MNNYECTRIQEHNKQNTQTAAEKKTQAEIIKGNSRNLLRLESEGASS